MQYGMIEEMALTFADGFAGFGGVRIGAEQAGLQPIWSIEHDRTIADVNRLNASDGHQMIVEDVCRVDPKTLPAPIVQHWSPPCINASNANNFADYNDMGTKETWQDMELAEAIIRFSTCHRPQIITLENVYPYRHFQSFVGGKQCQGIVPSLMGLGYKVRWWKLNAADYGVPQIRNRLFMVAARDFIPVRPEPTHQNMEKETTLFSLPAWNSWYSAVADLLPDLPDDKFAKWQIDYLQDYEFLMHTLVDGVVPGQRPPTMRLANQPATTVLGGGGGRVYRVFLMPGVNASNNNYFRLQEEPAHVVTSARSNPPRAQLADGRVVKLTPRCLARFQTFPDSFQLPKGKKLCQQGVGNAVPPLLYQRLIEAQLTRWRK